MLMMGAWKNPEYVFFFLCTFCEGGNWSGLKLLRGRRHEYYFIFHFLACRCVQMLANTKLVNHLEWWWSWVQADPSWAARAWQETKAEMHSQPLLPPFLSVPISTAESIFCPLQAGFCQLCFRLCGNDLNPPNKHLVSQLCWCGTVSWSFTLLHSMAWDEMLHTS